MGNSKKESAYKVLDIIKQMIEDDNKGLVLSTIMAKYGFPSKYMVYAFFIDREEYKKYKNMK